jgi:hypothetical protein
MNKLEKLQAKHAKEIALLEKVEAIFKTLPDIPSPLIVHNGGDYFGTNGTMIFRKLNKKELIEVVEAIESEWSIVAPSVVKYGNYRISEFPSLTPPKERGNVELKKHHAIYPVFIELSAGSGYSSQRLHFYATNPNGETYQIELDVKTPFHLNARRSEYRGGWGYVKKSASVSGGPQDIKPKMHGYVNTEHSISGKVYFSADLSMPISELVQKILL